MIDQNIFFVASSKKYKESGYLSNEFKNSRIFPSFQDFNLQIKLPGNINVFKVQAILLTF